MIIVIQRRQQRGDARTLPLLQAQSLPSPANPAKSMAITCAPLCRAKPGQIMQVGVPAADAHHSPTKNVCGASAATAFS